MTYYSYALVFDTNRVSSSTLRTEIDALDAVANWYAVMPALILVATNLSATDLFDLLRAETSLKSGKNFLVLDTNTDRNGWLSKSAWSFMRDPGPPTPKK